MKDHVQGMRNETLEPMTVNRLREHLFGGKKVSFWNYDPTKLSVGVEIEYFISRTAQSTICLASKQDYMQLVEILKRDSGYVDYNLFDQPGRISKDTEKGFVAIKPDFAWHILEISLPPRSSFDELRRLMTNIIDDLDKALSKANLQRLDISCLPDIPHKMDLVELDRLGLISKTFQPLSRENPTQNPHFPAFIAATHIHLNASSESTLGFLPNLYLLDKIISKRFTRAKQFCGRTYENARTLMYRNTLGSDYQLHTYPDDPPKCLADFTKLMNESPKLFPRDSFFPVRDMSYIRPTRYGTLEFRSACSFKSIDVIIEIAKWRVAQLMAASGVTPTGIYAELGEYVQELRMVL